MGNRINPRYEAYCAFMQRHRETVWAVCWRYAGKETRGDDERIERCKDMTQEVWLMVWLKFDLLYDDVSEWQQLMWLRKVTKSVLADLYRHESRDALADSMPIPQGFDLPEKSDTKELFERINELFSFLSPEEQRLMQLRIDGYDAAEIANALGIERNNVYVRINRIMKKIKDYAIQQ